MLKQYQNIVNKSYKGFENAEIEFRKFISEIDFRSINEIYFPLDINGNKIFSATLLLVTANYPSDIWLTEQEIIDSKLSVDITAIPVISAQIKGSKLVFSYYYNISDIKNMFTPSERRIPCKIDTNSTKIMFKEICKDFGYEYSVGKKKTARISPEYRLFTDKWLFQVNSNEVTRGTCELLFNSCLARSHSKLRYNVDLCLEYFTLITAASFSMPVESTVKPFQNWAKLQPKEFVYCFYSAYDLLETLALDSATACNYFEFEQGFVQSAPQNYD